MIRFLTNVIIVIILILSVSDAHPVESNSTSVSNETELKAKDLYVFKTVIYEIGILTNATDDDSTDTNETQENVEVSFYTPNNISLLNITDLSDSLGSNDTGNQLQQISKTILTPILIGKTGNKSRNPSPDQETLANKTEKALDIKEGKTPTTNPDINPSTESSTPHIPQLHLLGSTHDN